MGYRKGMRDPRGGSETCSVDMRIDKGIGVRLRGIVFWEDGVSHPFAIPSDVF